MKKIIVTLFLVFAIMAFGQNKKAISQSDYSYGNSTIKKIKKYLEKKDYIKAETLIKNLSSDEITIAMDCFTLNIKEHILLDWNQKFKESNYSKLALGIFYSHKGWSIRGNSYASEVSEENYLSFDDYQQKSKDFLESIDSDETQILAESYSRLIRVYMSLGETKKEDDTFKKCKTIDPKKVWLYIHRLESIQPKWHGSIDKLSAFLIELPDDEIIRHIVNLKLVMDAFTINENYFKKQNISINEKMSQTITEVDKALKNDLSSVNKFVIYGYLTSLAQALNETTLLYTYFSKMEENYTLYPFGIME